MMSLLSWLCWGACQEGVCLDPHLHYKRISPRLSGELPFTDVAIKNILEAIEQSKNILAFKDDWDGEGSPAYKAATWQRAAAFLRHSALQLWQAHQVILDAPKILPGPIGSIDLHWKTDRREVLINIPEALDEPENFYGDDSVSTDHLLGQMVKGILDTSKDSQWLLMWLMQ
jgi:hypothetical protein